MAGDRDGHSVELSYTVAAAARGRGIAARALRLAAAAALADPAVTRLHLWTHEANTASRRVAERAGFTRDPAGDREREVKGRTWPTVSYVQPAGAGR